MSTEKNSLFSETDIAQMPCLKSYLDGLNRKWQGTFSGTLVAQSDGVVKVLDSMSSKLGQLIRQNKIRVDGIFTTRETSTHGKEMTPESSESRQLFYIVPRGQYRAGRLRYRWGHDSNGGGSYFSNRPYDRSLVNGLFKIGAVYLKDKNGKVAEMSEPRIPEIINRVLGRVNNRHLGILEQFEELAKKTEEDKEAQRLKTKIQSTEELRQKVAGEKW